MAGKKNGDRRDLKYLDENLIGPILKIQDPRQYSREDIIKSYYREIVLMAGKFTRPNIEKSDLVAEGIIGLMDAIERWDPAKSKGNPKSFHNLAIIRIKSAMYNFFLANSGRYKFPSYMARGLNYLGQARRTIEESHYPGAVEDALRTFDCAEFDDWASPEVVRRLRKHKRKLADLAKSIKSDYETTVDQILRAEQNIEDHEKEEQEEVANPEELASNKEYIDTLLDSLHEDTREIIRMSLEGKTLEEIGEVQGKTRQRIQQIRDEFLNYLKRSRMYKSSFEE